MAEAWERSERRGLEGHSAHQDALEVISLGLEIDNTEAIKNNV